MSEKNAPKEVHFRQQYYEAIVDHYYGELRLLLLDRLVMPLLDPCVERVAREMASKLNCPYSEAIELLAPVARGVYHAAREFRYG